MKPVIAIAAVALIAIAAFGIGSYVMEETRDGPAEQFGETIDDAAEDVGEAAEDVGDSIEQAGDRVD